MASKRGKRSFASLQVASESGQIMRFYLQRQFFSRFKRIVFNTVHCNFSDTARQLAVRKEKRISNSRTLERLSSVEANTFLLQRQSLNQFIASCGFMGEVPIDS